MFATLETAEEKRMNSYTLEDVLLENFGVGEDVGDDEGNTFVAYDKDVDSRMCRVVPLDSVPPALQDEWYAAWEALLAVAKKISVPTEHRYDGTWM